jgi:L-ascorbate metabolism protein UlaG (beta-lactamase superfamily)
MAGLEVDIAVLPIGGASGMDAAQAAEAANLIGPKFAIPLPEGSRKEIQAAAQAFAEACAVSAKTLKPQP